MRPHRPTLLFVCGILACPPVRAAQLPSLFRGVVLADSALGVRVISVQEGSQAALADLRPEDIIVRVGEREIGTIDAFAAVSAAMKGRSVRTTLVVFRNGEPRELRLHLFSYPVLDAWGIEAIPDHDLRFAEPRVGFEYWGRLGRGFEEAGKRAEALNAYLNALHHHPDDAATAFHVSALCLGESRAQLQHHELAAGLATLRQGLLVMERLFNFPLSDAQLGTLRAELAATLEALRAAGGSRGDARAARQAGLERQTGV